MLTAVLCVSTCCGTIASQGRDKKKKLKSSVECSNLMKSFQIYLNCCDYNLHYVNSHSISQSSHSPDHPTLQITLWNNLIGQNSQTTPSLSLYKNSKSLILSLGSILQQLILWLLRSSSSPSCQVYSHSIPCIICPLFSSNPLSLSFHFFFIFVKVPTSASSHIWLVGFG